MIFLLFNFFKNVINNRILNNLINLKKCNFVSILVKVNIGCNFICLLINFGLIIFLIIVIIIYSSVIFNVIE